MRLRGATPAVVVGGTLNSLGVVRSLARAAVPTFVLGISRACPAAWSRHARFVCIRNLEGKPLIDALVALGTRLKRRPVLILTADQSVETVSACLEEIQAVYRICLPAHDTVRALSDKALFQKFSEREGFPVPRGVVLTREDELDDLASLTPPLILKPASKSLVLKGIVERAVRAGTLQEARTAAGRMLKRANPVLAQEWINGADSDIFFTLFSCGADGRVLSLFVGRKLVSSPPAIGSTAICTAATESREELVALTERFLERTHYRGLGSLEFKRESSSGRFQIVEPTVGRTDWQEEIATLCGQNIPLLTYRAAVGEPDAYDYRMTACPARSIAWRASMGHRRPRGQSRLRAAEVDGYWRWSDPVPALYYYGYERFVRRIWRRGLQKLRGVAASSLSGHATRNAL